MKKLLFYLLIFISCIGCRATKDTTSIQHSRDSITTIVARPVALRIKPDTATQTLGLGKFSQDLQKAAVGQVVVEKQGRERGVKVRLIKSAPTPTDSLGFEIEAISTGKDTTIYVHDTLTVVRDKTLKTVVHIEKPTFWQGLKTRINWMILGVIIIVCVLFAWHVERRIN